MAHLTSMEQTNSLSAEFKRLAAEAGELARRLAPDEWNRRADAGSWSVAEHIEHLTLTTEALLPRLDQARRQAPPAAGSAFRTRWMERLLLWYLEPPYRRGARTSPAFEPLVGRAAGQVLPRFAESQAQLEMYVQNAVGLALDRVRVVSPFRAGLKYSAWAALLILAAHQRRHLWQAGRLRDRIRSQARS
jgi:hypothetical protein